MLAETTRKTEIEGKLAAMERVREDAIKAAKFPIPSLTISSDGWLSVRKKDTGAVVPFDQENTAKRILGAYVIFAETRPKLRAFVIKQGANDLDHDSLLVLSRLCKRYGIPTFIEVLNGDPTVGAVVYRPQGAAGGSRSCNAFCVNYDEHTAAEGGAEFTAKLAVDGLVTFG